MTARQFVAVAIRIFALWMGISSVQSLITILEVDENYSAVAYVAYAIAYALFAWFLWMFPMTIAGRILKAAADDSDLSVTPAGIVHAAIIAAGLLLLVGSLPELFNTVAYVIASPPDEYSSFDVRAVILIRIASPLIQICFALGMIFRAHTLARYLSPR